MSNPFGLPNFKEPKIDLGLGSSKPKFKRQSVAQSTKRAIEIKQKGKCAICGKQLIGSKHFDHKPFYIHQHKACLNV